MVQIELIPMTKIMSITTHFQWLWNHACPEVWLEVDGLELDFVFVAAAAVADAVALAQYDLYQLCISTSSVAPFVSAEHAFGQTPVLSV